MNAIATYPENRFPNLGICRARASAPDYPICLMHESSRCPYSLSFGMARYCRHPERAQIVAKTIAMCDAAW
ncbi:MAG: hypothetical protein WC740_14600 [Verrucomicrobiia bacterium]